MAKWGGIRAIFRLAFGMAGIGARLLEKMADAHGIEYVYRPCSVLPLLGVFTVILHDIRKLAHAEGRLLLRVPHGLSEDDLLLGL